MTHLVIENQNSNVEIVSVAIIQKVYEMALSAQGSVSLKGNLQSEHAKQAAYNYLTGNLPNTNTKRFPQLDLNVTSGIYIDFQDSLVEQILLQNNIGDGIGILQSDLYAINRLEESWFGGSNITSFNELQYFKPSAISSQGQFEECRHLTEITLPSGITQTPKKCFKNNILLETVNNTSSLTGLNDTSFEGCSNLETIDLQNIVTINQYSFAQCGNLRSIGTGAPTTVGGHAFENCSSLTSINLSNCNTINTYAFKGCTNLSNVQMSSSSTTISSNAFQECTSLTSIDLSNVTSIGNQAFKGCTSLSSFGQLNPNFTSIPPGCFKGCTSLTSVDLSNITQISTQVPNNDNYDNGAFQGCTSLTNVIGLSDIDYIGGWSFTNCTSLGTNQDLVINTTQTFIGSAAFYKTKYRSVVVNGPNVTNLTNGYYKPFQDMPNCTYFDISNTVVTRGNGDTIPNKSNLETVILPSTLSSLNYSVWWFENNTVIKYFIILATTPPSYENTDYCKLGTNGNFYVPDNAVAIYKSTWPEIAQNNWNIHDHIKPLSELPVGVWKTGLYQQYEPYLSNSSDPAYATT